MLGSRLAAGAIGRRRRGHGRALGSADALALCIRSGPAIVTESEQLVLPLAAPLAAGG